MGNHATFQQDTYVEIRPLEPVSSLSPRFIPPGIPRREIDDKSLLARKPRGLGNTLKQLDKTKAREILQESVALLRQMGHKLGLAFTLAAQGKIALAEEDTACSAAHCGESVDVLRHVSHRFILARPIHSLGQALQAQGSIDERKSHSPRG